MLRRGFLISSSLALGAALAPTLESLPDAAPLAQLVSITGPVGRLFAGSSVPALMLPAAAGERVVVDIPVQRGINHFIRRPEHTLVIGRAGDGERTRLYAADTRHIRSMLRHHNDVVRLPIPTAYVLDELTLGLIWAIANLDDSLLDDDAELYNAHGQLTDLDKLNRSAAGQPGRRPHSAVPGVAWVRLLREAHHQELGHAFRDADVLDLRATRRGSERMAVLHAQV